jgi:hypothetical protein
MFEGNGVRVTPFHHMGLLPKVSISQLEANIAYTEIPKDICDGGRCSMLCNRLQQDLRHRNFGHHK